MNLSGQVRNLREPIIQLKGKSPLLDLDRFLTVKDEIPTSKEVKDSSRSEPSTKERGDSIPDFLRTVTVKAEVNADRVRYRRQELNDLTLEFDYERAVLKRLELKTGMGGGSLSASGAADLQKKDTVSFILESRCDKIPVDKMLLLLGSDEASLSGPLTLKTHLEGLVGAHRETLPGLKGKLAWECGPGRIVQKGPIGRVLFDVLSQAALSSARFKKPTDDLVDDGIAYQSLKGLVSLDKGTVTLDAGRFESTAINIDAMGVLSILDMEMDLQVALGLLGTLDKMINWVPLAGKIADRLTKVYVGISGPAEDPKVRVLPIKGVTEGLKAGGESIGSMLENLFGPNNPGPPGE
jgi:uncharacterized protein YhdP